MSAPRVSVVVPARNAAATLGRTLAALAEQDLDAPYEVIVVDNRSTDATGSIASAAAGPVRVVAGGGGRAGEARNRGAEAARAPVLAFTDADCVPERTWLRRGLAAMAAADLVQGAVHPDPDAERGAFDRTVSVTGETGLFETANLICSSELFARLGGFEDVVEADPEAPFGEDVWFGWRARRAGWRTAFAADAIVHHTVFPRGPLGHVAEARRRGLFCALVARVPELRERFLYRRVFLSRRTAAFDLAVVALAVALRSRSPLPLAAVVPYARLLVRETERRGPGAGAVEVAADAVGLAALVRGSLRERTLVL